MKITIQHYDSKAVFEEPDGILGEDLAIVFRKIMFWMGYHPTTIDEVLSGEE